MERLLHASLAGAAVLLVLLFSRASSAAVSSHSLLLNHLNVVNNLRTSSRGHSGSDISLFSADAASSSRPLTSIESNPRLKQDNRTPDNAKLTNVSELLCPRCVFNSYLKADSLSVPVPSAATSSSLSSSSNLPRLSPLALVDQNQMLTEEEMKELQLERFKAQILAKMHLKEKPQVNIRREELRSLISSGIVPGMLAGFSDPAERPTPPPNTIILSTKSEPCHRRHSQKSSCFVITLEGSVSEGVSTAILWLWRVRDGSNDDSQSLVVTQIFRHPRHNHGRSQGTIIAQSALSTASSPGWVAINISEAVSNWAMDGMTEVTIEISCPTCNGKESPVSLTPDQKPFVIVTMQPPKIRQQRSTAECSTTPVGGCCRASMNVSLEQMGWEDWIFQPTSFDFYYCRGHCSPSSSDSSGETSNYIDMLNSLIRQQPRGSARRAALLPCCSPTSYTPIDIMYIKNTTVHMQRINDLIVESCGCNG